MAKCKISFDHFTKEQVEELSVQLAALSKRDTDFPDASELTGDERLAIVQDGANVLASMDDISDIVADKLEPIIPTEETVAEWGFTKNEGTYIKPDDGIPKSDFSEQVQSSLNKADTAVQTETDPTVPSWAKQASKPSYTAEEVGAQEVLVSGINVKTINGNSILGSGNIDIQASAADAVKYVEQSLTSAQKEQARTNIGAGTYSVPSGGIPSSDMSSGVRSSLSKANTALQTESDPTVPSWAKQPNKPSYSYSEISNTPDLSQFITNTVNDLTNYYLKSETYTKEEVQQLISTIQGFSFEVVSVLPTASADTMGKIYLVPSADPQTQNVKDEYITIESSGSYAWEIIGSTSIDLSGYVTTTQLNTALAAYTTSADLTTLLAGKQDTISDLSDIRSGAAAGATAYQKPSTGIPASDMANGVIPDVSGFYTKPSNGIPSTDLSSDVQASLALADTALQSYTETDPTVPSWAKQSSKPSYSYSEIGNTPTIPDELADLQDDATHRLVTDTEKSTWNAKQDTISDLPTIRSGAALGATAIQSETDPTVPHWAKQPTKPSYTASEVGAVPTGQGLPSGGSTGQVLKKASATDYDVEWANESGGGGISTITLTFTPNEGETYFGTKAQAATALGITENEVDSLMAGDYDRLIFNGLYADKSTPGQVTSDAAYQRYVAADYNGVPYSLFLIYEDGGYACWWERQVPALSTSIYSDGNSNTKAATPKAVKDYIDDLPIPRQIYLGAFTPTESSSYISLGNASAAAASLNIEEEELYNLYEGAYNRLVMYDIATGKERIAHDALRIDEGGGATYEMLAPDGTPYVLDFLYESSAYKYRYYSVVGDIATILASI